MPRKQDGPDRGVEFLLALASERAGLEPERPTTGQADQPALEGTGPVRRQPAPWFEPDQPDPAAATWSPVAAGQPQPVTSLEAPRRAPRAWLLLAPALALAVGLAVGFVLGSTRADGDPASAPATRSPATQPAAAPSTSVVVQLTATPACLETVRRADRVIARLVDDKRDKVAELLVAYNVASRQCRRDASP
jgi:hypothetical protein